MTTTAAADEGHHRQEQRHAGDACELVGAVGPRRVSATAATAQSRKAETHPTSMMLPVW